MTLSAEGAVCRMRPLLLLATLLVSAWPMGTAAVAQRRAQRPARASARAPETPAPPTPPALGHIEGDIFYARSKDRARTMAVDVLVQLVPASTARAALPLCAALDSAGTRYRHLRRDARVAADSGARGARRRRVYWRGVADSLASGLPEALARVNAADAAVVRILGTLPRHTTGEGHYSVAALEPGTYLLYARGGQGSWFERVDVPAGNRSFDLSEEDVRETRASPSWFSVGNTFCEKVPDLLEPLPADAGTLSDAIDERAPELLNVRETQDQAGRRFPTSVLYDILSGEATLIFRVLADGSVDPYSIEVLSSSHPAFEDPAMVAAEVMRFRPAEVAGQPVRVWVRQSISFRMAF